MEAILAAFGVLAAGAALLVGAIVWASLTLFRSAGEPQVDEAHDPTYAQALRTEIDRLKLDLEVAAELNFGSADLETLRTTIASKEAILKVLEAQSAPQSADETAPVRVPAWAALAAPANLLSKE